MSEKSKPQESLSKQIFETPATVLSPMSGRLHFSPAAPQGFGDRHNSWAWSMLWWRDKLYVGTNRAWHCAERAGISSAFPMLVKYAPKDPDVECAPDPCDLPLQAEIWRWTPETQIWERVYQSPQDVPIPGHPGKYVARDVGFRDMAVFVEPDGSEAMYVSGVNSRLAFRPVPPPRLLQSVDGVSFEPVPQEAGTFLGELDVCTFRTITIYRGRLFVIAGSVRGDGVVIESSTPAGGNNHFRQISPPHMSVFEMVPFCGYLYLGLRDPRRGYAIVKTDATGELPYTFTPVVTHGGFLPKHPSLSVISMQVFNGMLYVGTDRPGEMIRIRPDDTWDLVVGTSRQTPEGWKYPISGLDAGFGNLLNGHIWRMREYLGHLYVGTWNLSTEFRNAPGADSVLEPHYGFDLFETANGWHYVPVTTTGFGDKFSCGVRSFADTPYGLFVGTANKWYGLQIWRGVPEESVSQDRAAMAAQVPKTAIGSGPGCPQATKPVAQQQRASKITCPPIERLEVEHNDHSVLLSWERPGDAERFRIWRADVTDERQKVESNPFVASILKVARALLVLKPDLYVPPLPDRLWIPGAYAEIGVTQALYFEDATAMADKRYLYYVQAEDHRGNLSISSNIVAIPLLAPPVTFASLLKVLDSPQTSDKVRLRTLNLISETVRKAQACARLRDVTEAERSLESLSRLGTDLSDTLDPLFLDDFQILLAKLKRRLALTRTGLIASSAL